MNVQSNLIAVGKTQILKDFRFNPLTTSERTTLASGLGAGNKGLGVWDTDLNEFFLWSGTAFVPAVPAIAGAMTFIGGISDDVNEPTANVGDTFVWTGTAATLTWSGITFNPSAVVQPGDTIIKQDATNYVIVQGNSVQATELVSGIMKIATQAIANAGSNDTDAITALKLAGVLTNKALAKTYFVNSVSLVADTPFTVTHNLALQNKDAFVISVKNTSGSEELIDVDSVDVNSCTITSGTAATGVKVTVIGF